MSGQQQPPPLPRPDPRGSGPGDPGSVPPPLPGAAPPPLPDRLTGHGPMPSPARLPDPGPLPDPAILHTTEDTRTYPCPSCGGMLRFDAEAQGLKCPSCAMVVPLDPRILQPAVVPKRDLATTVTELARLVDQHPKTLEREVVCQSCGGHTPFTGSFTAVRCPYCNTPIQRDDVQAAPARLKIDGILPFQVSEKRARDEVDQWINSRWFAPNEFKKYRELGSFTSIYLAYFDYDAQTRTRYTGQRGIRRTVQVQVGNQTRTEVRTDWYPAAGEVENTFTDVTGLANTGLDEVQAQGLEPWPMHTSRRYSPEFGAGHLSRTYDLGPDQVFQSKVRPRMESTIESTVRRDIGGDAQQVHSMDISWLSLNVNQLAVPVWMLTVTYQQRPFQVLINGVTGEVQGRRPVSAVKVAIAVIAGILVLIVIFVLVQFLGS